MRMEGIFVQPRVHNHSLPVNVVLPASGCGLMADVRRFEISLVMLTKIANNNRTSRGNKPSFEGLKQLSGIPG